MDTAPPSTVRHVLVADADPDGVGRARAALAGVDVEAVSAPPAMLERLVGSAFDLLLLDLMRAWPQRDAATDKG